MSYAKEMLAKGGTLGDRFDEACAEVDSLREQLGLIVDTCDNGLSALKMPLPDSIHKEGLTGIVESVKRLATPPFNTP